jgi:hypothetical protein
MATSEVDVCNTALALLGGKPIVALGEASDRARLCTQFYPKARDYVLKAHKWSFAIQRAVLLAYRTPAATITLAATTLTASVGVFSASDVGGRILGIGVVGDMTIVGFTSDTVVTVTVAAAPAAPLTSGQWKLYYPPPAHTFGFTLALPSDCIRLLHPDDLDRDTPRFRLERIAGVQRVVSESDELHLSYVARVTDPTQFDELFEEALSHYLAYKLAFPVTGQIQKARDMLGEYKDKVMEARSIDSQQGTPERMSPDDLIGVRFGRPQRSLP